MAVNTLTLYMPGSSVGIQVYEGSQLHLILVSQGANSIPSAPGQTVRADPFPQYIDADELAAALAGVDGTVTGGGIRIWDGSSWSGRPAGVPAGYVTSYSDGSNGSVRDPNAADPGGVDGDVWEYVTA